MKRKKKKSPLELSINKYNRNIAAAQKRNKNELLFKIDPKIIDNLTKGEKSTLSKQLNKFTLRGKPKQKTTQNKEYRNVTKDLIKTLETFANKRIVNWNETVKTNVIKLNGEELPTQNITDTGLALKNFNITTKGKLDLTHYTEGLFKTIDTSQMEKRLSDMKQNYLDQLWVQIGVYDPESYLQIKNEIENMSDVEFLKKMKENIESYLPFIDSPKARGKRGGMFTLDLGDKVESLKGVWSG